MNTLRFTDDDLAANRRGELTPEQANRVQANYRYYTQQGRMTVVMLLLFFSTLTIVFGIIQAVQSQRNISDFLRNDVPALAIVPLMVMLLASISLVFSYFNAGDLRRGRIRHVDGTAQPEEGEGYIRGGKYYYYNLRLKQGRRTKKLFRFSDADSLKHFLPGQTYRVYYIEHYPLPLVLSTVQLDKPKRG